MIWGLKKKHIFLNQRISMNKEIGGRKYEKMGKSFDQGTDA